MKHHYTYRVCLSVGKVHCIHNGFSNDQIINLNEIINNYYDDNDNLIGASYLSKNHYPVSYLTQEIDNDLSVPDYNTH